MPTLQFKGKNIIWNHHLSVPYQVLDLMTKQKKEKKIYAYQTKLPFPKVNEDAEFYLVEQGKEEQTVKSLMR